MTIATAAPVYPASISDALSAIEKLSATASQQGAAIICFPESYLPGYPLTGSINQTVTAADLQAALGVVCKIAKANNIAIIMPMDWYEEDKIFNVAYVISSAGNLLGRQTKNQLDPSEDVLWTAGTTRQLFDIDGVTIGITICHEGFRYPESVRWAAMNGAQIVFHPNFTGSDVSGPSPTVWGHHDNPYYEKAQMLRAMENTVYFVTSNYAFQFPESASAVIAPDGSCVAYQPYNQPGVVAADIDLSMATGLLAKRFKKDLYKK